MAQSGMVGNEVALGFARIAEAPALALMSRDLIEAGTIRPAVGRTYPLAEASTAVGDLAAGNAPGKLVITID